jgi:hypothetical protein
MRIGTIPDYNTQTKYGNSVHSYTCKLVPLA